MSNVFIEYCSMHRNVSDLSLLCRCWSYLDPYKENHFKKQASVRLNVKSIVLFNVILLLCFLTLTYLNIIHVSHKGVQWQLDTGGNPYCEVPCALQRAAFIPSSCRPTWAECTSPQYHVHTLHITAGLYRASHISSNTAMLSNIAKQSQMRCDSWPRSVFVRYFETAVISWALPSLSSSSHFRDRDQVLQLHSGYTCSMYIVRPRLMRLEIQLHHNARITGSARRRFSQSQWQYWCFINKNTSYRK